MSSFRSRWSSMSPMLTPSWGRWVNSWPSAVCWSSAHSTGHLSRSSRRSLKPSASCAGCPVAHTIAQFVKPGELLAKLARRDSRRGALRRRSQSHDDAVGHNIPDGHDLSAISQEVGLVPILFPTPLPSHPRWMPVDPARRLLIGVRHAVDHRFLEGMTDDLDR